MIARFIISHNRTTQSNNTTQDKRTLRTTMSHASGTCDASAAIANVECSGVFCPVLRVAGRYDYSKPYDYFEPVRRFEINGDYHLFLRCGDKVYMEARGVGEVVISFAELQKKKEWKRWKHYYDLSLLLANDKHKVIKNTVFNNLYDKIYEYTGDKRDWSLDTSYIELDIDRTYKIIPSGNVCYYKINPFDLEDMEYSSPQELELFERTYISYGLLRLKYFQSRSAIYNNIAIEYNVAKMEKELEELSRFFENKNDIVNLTAIQKKHKMNIDVLMIIYKHIVVMSDEEDMVDKIEKASEAKTALELVSQIIAA